MATQLLYVLYFTPVFLQKWSERNIENLVFIKYSRCAGTEIITSSCKLHISFLTNKRDQY